MSGEHYILTLRPTPDCEFPAIQLRRGLKYLLRSCDLRCIDVREVADVPVVGKPETAPALQSDGSAHRIAA